MKGFLGVKSIFMLVVLIVLFGSAMYDVSITGVRCGLGVVGKGNYTCDEFGSTVGASLIFPDRNVRDGVDSILILRDLKINQQDIYEEIKDVVNTDEQNYKNQILIGLAGILVLIVFLVFICIKASPSSGIDAGSMGISILCAILLYSFVYVAYTGLVEGETRVPFEGVISLINHPDVLGDIVDYTAALPGTTTVDDIVNVNEEGGHSP